MQHLDRDVAVQRGVPPSVHRGHAALADLLQHLVFVEGRTDQISESRGNNGMNYNADANAAILECRGTAHQPGDRCPGTWTAPWSSAQ